MKKQKKIVLAYSGGLDTSIILKWLQENYDAEVIAYTADVGQEMDKKKIIKNAKKLGVKKIIIQDLKNIFVKDYVYPMIRGHALYEGVYLLGTSIARPLIAKDQIRVAKKFNAYAVSHGSTGKGNDQVRFELGYHYFAPKIKIIATNFNFLGIILFISLIALIIMRLLNALIFKSAKQMLYQSYFGIVIFTLYLVYDFDRLKQANAAGDNSWGTAVDIAVNIYLDIINLFIELLIAMGESSQ